MDKLKKNWQLVLIVLVTIILGTIAVVTAIRLAQIGQEPIAPTAPTSKPEAAFLGREPTEACTLSFNVSTEESPSPSPSESPSPSPVPECYEECIDDEDCPQDYEDVTLVCQDIDGVNLCVNDECPEEEDCLCPEEESPSPSPSEEESPSPSLETAAASPSPKVELPEAGIISPTIIATLGGIILVLIGLFL